MATEYGTTGLGTNWHYGARETGNTLGGEPRLDNVIRFGVELNSASMQPGRIITNSYIPAGALIKEAYLIISEDCSDFDGPLTISYMTEQDPTTYVDIVSVTAAEINQNAPKTIAIVPLVTNDFDHNYRLTINYEGTVIGAGKFDVLFVAEAKVTTGIGPINQPPDFRE